MLSATRDSFGLWKTDGTPERTFIVYRFATITNLTVFKNQLYLVAPNKAGNGHAIWKSGGIQENTSVHHDLRSTTGTELGNLFVLGENLFFTANLVEGVTLFKTNGVDAPQKVTTFSKPTASKTIPTNFIALDNMMYFSFDDGEHGKELWVTDGTADGTRVIDIVPGPGGSNAKPLKSVDGKLYFAANSQLWHLSGTYPHYEMLADMEPLSVQVAGRMVYFASPSAQYGVEMFRVPVRDVPPVLPPNWVGETVIYPNPVENTLYLTTPSAVRVVDINGKEILNYEKTTSVDVTGIKPGIYVAIVNGGESFRFVKR